MNKTSIEEWYSKASNFEWNGYQVVYRIENGNKPWLCLIHGFPSASYDWSYLWESLKAHFSLIALDMIGFGYSDKPKSYPYSIMDQANLIEKLLRHLSITDVHLMAHDYGDTVAQELIARGNEGKGLNWLSACLLNGGIFPESHHPLPIQKMLMSRVGFILSRLLNQRKFEHSFGRIFGPNTKLTKEELNVYWKLVAYKNGHRIAHLLIRYMKERVIHRQRWVASLQEFKNPLGLINGLVDPISGQVMVDRYRQLISEENIWTMDHIGHYPQLEAPNEVLKAYYSFMNIQE